MVLASVVLCLVALGGLLVAEARDSQAGRWACKPVASAAFVLAAVGAGARASGYGRAILVGQALGLVGDCLLIRRGQGAFVAGLATFLAGHVAFVVAFLRPPAVAAPWAVALATAAVLPAALGLHRWLLPHVPSPLRWPVRAYLGVISAMVVAVTAAPASAQPWALVGAVAFFLSDICVARDKFVAPGPGNSFVGLPLYYGAQLLLAASVAP